MRAELGTSKGSAAVLKAVRADRIVVGAAFVGVLGTHTFRQWLGRGVVLLQSHRLLDHLRHGDALPRCDVDLTSLLLLGLFVRPLFFDLVPSHAQAARHGLAHVHVTF